MTKMTVTAGCDQMKPATLLTIDRYALLPDFCDYNKRPRHFLSVYRKKRFFWSTDLEVLVNEYCLTVGYWAEEIEVTGPRHNHKGEGGGESEV